MNAVTQFMAYIRKLFKKKPKTKTETKIEKLMGMDVIVTPHAKKPFLIPKQRFNLPASQTYTLKKIRGLPPMSARNKRMWRSATKEELEECI